MPIDLIIVAVLVVVIGAAILKIVSEKKKGHKCVGCPHSSGCDSKKKS